MYRWEDEEPSGDAQLHLAADRRKRAAAEDVLYMLCVYAKNEQGDLTRAQIRVLARIVREEFK